jgi:hypothetical protein
MAKKDGPSKRLAKNIAWSQRFAKSQRERTARPAPVYDVFKGISIPLGGWLSLDFEWRPVREAFKKFGLDPGNPHDWERLIHDLADAHFGGTRGRWTVWTSLKLCRLAADFAAAKAAHPGKLHKDIRKLLKKKDRYRKLDTETIRRRLPEARKELAQAVADCRKYLRDGQIDLTPDQELKLPAVVSELIANCNTDSDIGCLLTFDFPFGEVVARLGGK